MEGPQDSTSASMEQGEGSHVPVEAGTWCSDSEHYWQVQQPAESLQVWDCALSPAAPYLPFAWGRAVRAMAMLRVKELVPTTLSLFSGKYDKITITKTIFNKKKFISHFYTNIHR